MKNLVLSSALYVFKSSLIRNELMLSNELIDSYIETQHFELWTQGINFYFQFLFVQLNSQPLT